MRQTKAEPFDYLQDSGLLTKTPEELLAHYGARSLYVRLLQTKKNADATSTIGVIDSTRDIHLKHNNWSNLGELIGQTHTTAFLLYEGASLENSFRIVDIVNSQTKIYPMQLFPETLQVFDFQFSELKAREIIADYNNR